MSKDHYVAQTYLKHFIDPKLGNLLHAYDKEKLNYFTPRTEDICYAEGWDTNPYFEDNKLIDKYLKVVEPKWNHAVKDIVCIPHSENTKYVMAMYIAYLTSCTPTAVRNVNYATSEMFSSSTRIIAKQALETPKNFPEIPHKPDILEKIISSGGFAVNVDPKHTHAEAMKHLTNLAWHFYKSPWMILHNKTDNLFLTSDFPVAYYYPKPRSQIPYRYIPISPHFAILIKPSLNKADRKAPLEIDEYPNTKVDISYIKPEFSKILNKLTIQGAEKFIISAYDEPWIMSIVKKYKDWKMDSGTVRLPHENGEVIFSRYAPRKQSG